tara:strand:+ start:439 stop:672 length:234 start_codon:yes stop_codon:yes gene_type:complete
MSKVKNYYWDLAEKEVDKITDEYLAGKIDQDTAENKISGVDNVNMLGIDEHNVGDHLYYAKEESKADVALQIQEGGK